MPLQAAKDCSPSKAPTTPRRQFIPPMCHANIGSANLSLGLQTGDKRAVLAWPRARELVCAVKSGARRAAANSAATRSRSEVRRRIASAPLKPLGTTQFAHGVLRRAYHDRTRQHFRERGLHGVHLAGDIDDAARRVGLERTLHDVVRF